MYRVFHRSYSFISINRRVVRYDTFKNGCRLVNWLWMQFFLIERLKRYGELLRLDLKVLSGCFAEILSDIVKNVDEFAFGLPRPNDLYLTFFQRSSSLIRFESSSDSSYDCKTSFFCSSVKDVHIFPSSEFSLSFRKL